MDAKNPMHIPKNVRIGRPVLSIGEPGDGTIPESYKDLPEMRCNADVIDVILKMVACSCEIENLIEYHTKRVKAIPGAWRDVHMMKKKIVQLYCGLVRTLPPPKMQSVLEMAPFVKYNIKYDARSACRNAEEQSAVIKLEDLSALCDVVWDTECHFCPNPNDCGKCRIGAAFDAVLTDDRGHGSWQDVDIRHTNTERQKGECDYD